MAFNANGIRGQTHELETLLYERNVDIVLLNETHLKSKDKFRMQNYYIYRNNRTDGPMGGTAIGVKKDVGHRVVNIPNLQFMETSGILLPISNNQEIFIGSIYKSPLKLLTRHDLDVITSISDRYILAGDFNAKQASWNSRKQNAAGTTSVAFKSLHRKNQLSITETLHCTNLMFWILLFPKTSIYQII